MLAGCTAGGDSPGATEGETSATSSASTADPSAGPGSTAASTSTASTTDPGSTTGDDEGETSETTGDPADCTPADPLPIACVDDWVADGECDPVNNFGDCGWDGGDCCESTCVDGGIECGLYGFDCRDPGEGGYGDDPPELIGDPCAEVTDPFDAAKLQAEVELLSTDALAGRRPGFRGDAITRRYLEERFACLELTPLDQGCYAQPFANDDGDQSANIIGYIAGTDPQVADEIIVVGAHHDHLGEEGGEVFNGANDNVSGVVALLAAIEAFRRDGVEPRRTVVFIAFGSEETGLEGAYHFTTNPPAEFPLADVVYMINLDMLGTYDVVGGVDAFGTFAGTPGREILEALLQDLPELNAVLGVASPEGDSDYDPFCAEGIPYVYFETFDPPCWHEPCDDPPRMDYPHMSQLARLKYELAVALANSDTDLAAARAELGCPREGDQQGAPPPKHFHDVDTEPSVVARLKRRALHRAMH